MTDSIPAAKLEHLLKVQHAVRNTANPDLRHAVRTALAATATSQEMMTAAIRLVALTNLRLLHPEIQRDDDTVDIAVLQAAARAPLSRGSTPALTVFDAESFRRALHEQSPPEDES